MRFHTWPAVVMAACALLMTSQAAAADCRLKLLTSLEMSYDAGGRPLVPAIIQGQDVRLLIDTGGVFGALTWRAVDQLKLRRDHISGALQIFQLNGERAKYMAHVDDLRLGKLVSKEYPFIVLPPDAGPSDAVGYLAPDTLSTYDLEFDFSARKLNLISPEHCKGQVVYWTQQPYVALPLRVDRSHQIYVEASIDGQSVEALIDTGATNSVLRLDEADAVLGRPLRSSELVHAGTGTDNGFDFYKYPFKLLAIGGIAVQNPDLVIATDKLGAVRQFEEIDRNGEDALHAPPMILGMNVLRKLHLYIAYKEETLYATGADAH
jgi:predicted aspartyl protease